MELSQLTVSELLALQSAALEELRRREVLRTANNPLGDYTEWMVAKRLGLQLAGNSSAGYDAVSADGVRVQIKGRRVSARNPSRQLSAIRNLEGHGFDYLIAVVFNEAFEIVEAVSIPHPVVREYASYRQHVNGHILHVRGRLLEDPRVKSLRNELSTTDNLSAVLWT